jgi:L-fucose mutarotase
MLKNIDPLLSPELIFALARMGHGELIAIVDRNFPACAAGAPVVRADATDTTTMARAVFSLMPIDTFIERPIQRMLVVDDPDAVPAVHREFLTAAADAEGRTVSSEGVERFAFYDRVRQASVIVATGETRPYGCFLVTKGVVTA